MEPSLAHYPALLRDLSEMLGQLQANDPADFGRVARRTSEPAERLLELLWLARDTLVSFPMVPLGTDTRGETPLDVPVAYCVRSWMDWVYDRNQFFELAPAGTVALREAHRMLFRSAQWSLVGAETHAEFARRCQLSYIHFAERLARIFRSLTTPEGLRGRGAEYSAELQLQLLGLNNHDFVAPIVDLGCGVDAALIRHLRERGLNATGLERRGRSPFVMTKDWFDVRFEPNTLGTILSHLAFSLQFLHHHWHPGDRAYLYAQKYTELLRSLIPGGLFCYSPGLPFIESLLDPQEFEVSTLPLPEPLATTIASLRDLGTGQSVAYTCQIRRRVLGS